MARAIDAVRHEAWRQRMERFSGWSVTAAEFCRREGVTQATFYQWRRRFARQRAGSGSGEAVVARTLALHEARRPSPAFVELAVTGGPALVEIELPNGAVVRIPAERESVLRAAIAAVGELATTGLGRGRQEVRP